MSMFIITIYSVGEFHCLLDNGKRQTSLREVARVAFLRIAH